MLRWEELPETIDTWAEKLAALAHDVRQSAAGVYTLSPVGYYCHADSGRVALFAPQATATDFARCKLAAEHGAGRTAVRQSPLSLDELSDPDTRWVKVAYSKVLRRIGEALNFFPGQYPVIGLPNQASPLAAMLTSGLLGAGLGWAGGKLLASVLPDQFGDNLGTTGLILGGLVGASPGLLWGITNKMTGRRFNDPELLRGEPGDDTASLSNADLSGKDGLTTSKQPSSAWKDTIQQLHDIRINSMGAGGNSPSPSPRSAWMGKGGSDQLADVPLAEPYRKAVDFFIKRAFADTLGDDARRQPSTYDVNINALGQTLWQSGASPRLAGSTMGAMYAAQQMPDPQSRPGRVTFHQLGQLAMNAAGNYMNGVLVGDVLNLLVGTPFSPQSFGLGNVALGIIGAAVPKLFGG
jgi:hypothetical protein